jgi:uncharacterized membrane protein
LTLHASELGGWAPSILLVHIVAGSISALSGAAALYFTKGSNPHRAAGTAFLVAMLTMSVSAAYLAVLIHDVTVFGAIFTIYLVATAWVAAKRSDGQTGAFEVVALLFALGVAATEFVFGVQAQASATGRYWNYPPAPYFVLTSVAMLAVSMDLKVIMRGGISGAARIARHLWRMCFALFIAVLSFIGQGLKSILPLTTPGALYVLLIALVPLVLMIYWLVRVRLTNWYQKAAPQSLPQTA